MPYRKLCTKLLLETQSAPNGHDYRITKYGANNSPISALVDVPNSEQYDFGKPAASSSGILLNPLHQKIISIKAQGNSTQAAGSVPKYTCQGKSKVYNQLIKNGNFATLDNWAGDGSSMTVADNVGAIVFGSNTAKEINAISDTIIAGHKYLVTIDLKAADANSTPAVFSYLRSAGTLKTVTTDKTNWNTCAFIDAVDTVFSVPQIQIRNTSAASASDTTIYVRNAMLVDLTTIYGAGNEPATVSAFLADYPFFADYVAYTTGAIHSISSITLGGQTVSVDLRSAGSVYDEWESNSHGTRKTGLRVYAAANVSATSAYTNVAYFMVYKPSDSRGYNNPEAYGTLNNYATVYPYYYNAGMSSWDDAGGIGKAFSGFYFGNLVFGFAPGTTLAEAQAALDGMQFCYELASANYSAFTAGSPLTLATGLTPTDQNGDSITFTESTEATPSPNYPVPIVNSTLISITDGQDTNSASIDLAGLTDKDQVFVNVKSTNIWDEVYETGGLYASDGSDWATSDRIRSKNYISVQGGLDYYFQIPSAYQIIVCWYDSEKSFISTTNYGYASTITAPANAAFCRFATSGSYGTTYNHDISISLGSSATPYMPHNTRGKVWKKVWVGSINIGNYTWNKSGSVFYRVFNEKQAGEHLMLCPKYKYKGNCGFNPPQYGFGDSASSTYLQQIFIKDEDYADAASFKAGNTGVYIYFNLKEPTWTDITSSAMGAALLAMETYEGDSDTATVDNGGQSNVEYWRQV